MKRFGMILAALLLLVGCAGPARNASAVFVDPNAVQAGAYGDLYFTANGYSFGIYDPIDEVLKHLVPNGTFAEASCAYEGEDVRYFFGGFEVMTNEIDGAVRVTAIDIMEDTVKTPDGLYIGMSEAALCDVLGVPMGDGLYRTVDGTAQRTVTVVDGTVRAISYLPAQ